MSSTKLSSNYQIVVPKDVRKKLNLTKGQPLYVQSVGAHSVSFTTESPVDTHYGILKGVLDEDVMAFQKQMRQDRALPEL
jgi:AbrB family looped-hinge helix DNA binding protein